MKIEENVIDLIFDAANYSISDVLPSVWAETNRYMTTDVSPVEGMFSFDNSPYTRKIVDSIAPDDPSRVIVVMKGAQIGFSVSVIENAIGWIISQNPGNIMYLVGHDSLVEKAGKKIENMIDTTGIRDLIQSTANRKNNNKKGDKDRLKEFSGGSLSLGIANHKALRQVSIKYGFIDDFESMKSDTKESGDTVTMIKKRFAAYGKSMKIMFISTPEVKETSNIEPEYLKGDQQKYHVPCPCCGEYIILEWTCDSEINEGEKAGIYWKLDDNDRLIRDSVGYVCQKCNGFFTDQHKYDMLTAGEWRATCEAIDSTYSSYHISALYAPTYMVGWDEQVQEYMEANPIGQPRNEKKHQAFVNLVLGQTYEPQGETIDSSQLEKNKRPYKIGVVPEKMSIKDGNGKIVLLTLGADMNGTVENKRFGYDDDARFDWEIVAWSESGSSYSVDHGSIGTFQPANSRNEAYHNHPDRVKWSYKPGSKHCVWDELDRILATKIQTDTGRNMRVFSSGVDSAPYTQYSYPYLERANGNVYGIKGDKLKDTGIFMDDDKKPFMISKENAKLWILNVNWYKDLLATHIGLNWAPHEVPKQPENFMNFPQPEKDKYTVKSYFSHFEAEQKVVDPKTNRHVWKKVTGNAQNHLFDCRIYAIAAKDVLLFNIFRELKIKNGTWSDYVDLVLKRK